MIKGIGLDLIELNRIEPHICKQTKLIERVLTSRERYAFERLPHTRRKVEYLAGRFATKEAFAKAAGTGIGRLSFQDIEIIPSSSGAPQLSVQGYEAYNLFLSITHTKEYAAAQVIIEEN